MLQLPYRVLAGKLLLQQLVKHFSDILHTFALRCVCDFLNWFNRFRMRQSLADGAGGALLWIESGKTAHDTARCWPTYTHAPLRRVYVLFVAIALAFRIKIEPVPIAMKAPNSQCLQGQCFDCARDGSVKKQRKLMSAGNTIRSLKA